jgi:predicted RNase H-like nuclease (RuvC/YqgF family)
LTNFDDVVETVFESLILLGYVPNEQDSKVIAALVISYTSCLIDESVEKILGDELYANDDSDVVICNDINDMQRLHDELQKQQAIAYSLRKRITALKGELRYERQKNGKLEKLLKEHKKKEHYRNGQKRGSHGRNG